MSRGLLLALLATIGALAAHGQGTVRGKVSDGTGEMVIGASVKVTENPAEYAMTDLDGNFSIKIAETTEVTITVSFITMRVQELKVHPQNGEVVIANFQLEEESKVLGAVIIEKKASTRS